VTARPGTTLIRPPSCPAPEWRGKPSVSLLNPEISARLQTLQSLDDAIAFRLNRLGSPCEDCTPDERCVDHAHDEGLIAGYRERHGSVLTEVFAGMDPEEVDQATRQGDGTPPTVIALSLAISARLRELAADGPFMTELDAGPVVIELDGPLLVEHPLMPHDDEATP
jgi:hypothetical protein